MTSKKGENQEIDYEKLKEKMESAGEPKVKKKPKNDKGNNK